MPKFALSTFGRTYVTDEEFDELPQIRWIFIIITLILGSVTLLKFLLHLFTIKSNWDRTCNYFPLTLSTNRIIICYILSHLIHNIHFADNIYRPVDYFEPKWLYNKYLFSEMEITFFSNFVISLSGLLQMERLVSAESTKNSPRILNACKMMSIYILGSFLTLGHYLTNPPWGYSLSVNFTIAGKGVATAVLALWLYKYYKKTLYNMSQSSLLDEEEAFQEHSKSL